jgi:RNA polymerase sigma factor (sigma-70 family)
MHASSLQKVLEHLRKWTDPARAQELSDADLLERFRFYREEAAFTLLVQRHGPMVLAVCRRILGDAHEAEDAFQATFLVLVRNAAAIRKQEALAGWLHGVASRIAHKARRRLAQQQLVGPVEKPDIHDDPNETLTAAELRAALDEEIERLPDKYRMPLVLCYLADKTHEQAAAELGWPKSSVTARLAQARELLQRRLTRRGFTAPAGLLAVLLTEQSTNAALPSLLTLATVRLAMQVLAGETLAATSAAGLAGSFVKSTGALKLMATLSLLAMLGFVAVGYRIAVPAPSEHPRADAPRSAQARKPRVDWQGDPLPDEAIVRMGSGRLRHPGLRALLFSSDNKRLLSSADKDLRIWDAETGKLVQRLDLAQSHKQTSCRWLSNNFIYIDVDTQWVTTVQILDTATGRVRRRVCIKEPANVYYPPLSPDGKRFAVAHGNEIRLYDTTTGETLQRIPFKGLSVWSIAFAPDGESIAFNDYSDTIYIYNTTTGKLIRELKRPGDAKLHLVFSPDGRFLASLPQNLPGAYKGELSIWNLRDGKEIQRWTHPFPMAASAAFSPDGKRVAFGGSRWGLVLRDIETGKEVYRLSPQSGVFAIAFSADGKILATASPGGVIRLWDAATGKLLPASAVRTCSPLSISASAPTASACSASAVSA